MDALELFLNKYFGEKAPRLPDAARRFFVSIAPFLCILGIIFGVMGILGLIGLGGYGAYMVVYGPMIWPEVIFSAAMVVLEILALPGLTKKTYSGWKYVFYASLLGLIYGIASYGSIVGTIIGLIIEWYFLFQMRPLYAGAPVGPTGPVPPTQTQAPTA